jgi:hypothetical protein
MSKGAVPSRIRLSAVTAVGVLWLFVGCVDLTPPWSKVTAQGGAGGSGGATPDGAAGAGGALDAGAGGRIDTGGLGGTSGEAGGLGGAIDAPPPGTGGATDAGRGGAGGAIDVAIPGTGGAAIDGGAGGAPDVPLPGTGGVATGGTFGGTGGKATGGTTTSTVGKATGGTTTGSGGKATGGTTTGTGGAARTGGASGTGGATGSGGVTGTGGTTTPDAGPDVQPDTSTLANGLLAYYPCESVSGTTLPDISGNGNHATLSAGGSYSFGPGGKVGNALTLIKNQSGYVSMPPAMFRGLTQITVATWVKVVTAVDWQRLFDIGVNANLSRNPTSGTNTIAYMNFVPQDYSGTSAVFAITNTGCANEQRISASALAAGTWRHVAIVLSGSTGTLYIDGGSPIVNNTMTLSPANLGNIDYAYIGRSQFSVDPYFDGMIDEFRVYNRALSAAEVQTLYNFTGP